MKHRLAWAWFLLAIVAGSQAVAQSSAPLNSEDPFIRLAQEIWSSIEARCAPPAGKPFQIVVLGVPPDDMRFTSDQKDYLAQKLTAATSLVLRNTPKAKASVSLREVAEIIAIMGAGESRAEVDRMIKEAENYNIGIQIRGGRFAQRGYRIALMAHGRNGATCIEQTSPADLPSDAFPEHIVAADELLSRAAQHVLERPSGGKEAIVSLRSRMADGRPTPEIWNESLARSFNRGVPLARRRLPSRSLEARDLRAEPSASASDAGGAASQSWRAEITLNDTGRTGTRLELDLRPPSGAGAEGTAFDGLIDPDSLPPVPMSQAMAAAQTSREKTRAGTASSTGGPATQPISQPSILPLKSSAQRLRVSLDSKTSRREFAFAVPQSTILEVDLQEISKEDGPSVAVLDTSNRIIAPVGPPAVTRPHLKRWRLSAGAYMLWLEHKASKPVDFILRTRAGLDSLIPEPVGNLVAVAGDWAVGIREQPNASRVCYAFTPATATEPQNWRVLAPFLLFQITAGDDTVQHRLDNHSEWAPTQAVTAEVLKSGTWSRLPLQAEDGVLKSLEPCKSQQGQCLAESTLYGLSSGAKVSLLGSTKDGKQGMVEYSLNGYQAAMHSMATLCDQKSLAARLVVRR